MPCPACPNDNDGQPSRAFGYTVDVSVVPQSAIDDFAKKTDKGSSDLYFYYYGMLQHQQNMLQDYIRTGTYWSAIIENAPDFQGKVVMDVGAGSGILSLFAAQVSAPPPPPPPLRSLNHFTAAFHPCTAVSTVRVCRITLRRYTAPPPPPSRSLYHFTASFHPCTAVSSTVRVCQITLRRYTAPPPPPPSRSLYHFTASFHPCTAVSTVRVCRITLRRYTAPPPPPPPPTHFFSFPSHPPSPYPRRHFADLHKQRLIYLHACSHLSIHVSDHTSMVACKPAYIVCVLLSIQNSLSRSHEHEVPISFCVRWCSLLLNLEQRTVSDKTMDLTHSNALVATYTAP